MALRSTLRRKRKQAERRAAEARYWRNSLWYQLVVLPFLRALILAVPLYLLALVRGTNASGWIELLDRFTIAFLLLYLLMVLIAIIDMVSRPWVARFRRRAGYDNE